MLDGGMQTAVVMLLVAASVVMGGFLTRAQLPQQLAAGILEFTVSAGLDDSTLINHENAVGLEHGRQPMGDDHGRALGHEAFEGALNGLFALRIERACRLVEQ